MSSSSGLIELLMPPSLLARRIFFGMTHYLIYKITNLVNGKMYIGKHMTDDIDDGYMGSGKILKRAINKYGINCFRKEYLMSCESKEEMDYMERVFVDETWVSRSDTYNIKIGGEGGSYKGINKGKSHPSWLKGKKLSDEHKQAVSRGTKKAMARLPPEKRAKLASCKGKTPWNKGKKTPEEVCALKYKPVIQYTKDGKLVQKYSSAKEASAKTGICRSSICFCLKGRYKLAGGFIWKYA